jgi:uncharacterized protein (DUF1015 family)
VSDVRPFAALRYASPGALDSLLAGPYDVIAPEERERLAEGPHNVVHLTLPPGLEGQRDYPQAAQTLTRWVADGVLVRDPVPQFYLLEEHTQDGRVRRGFLALLRLADYEEGVVLPHEFTMPGPKLDRLRLTRAVRANVEPLFFIYEDRDAKLGTVIDAARTGAALAHGRSPDGTQLQLFGISEPAAIGSIQGFLADLPVIIADGHHRYETMLTYRDECRAAGNSGSDAPHEFVLAYLVNAFDPGSEIRAIHRVLEGSVAELAPVLAAADFRSEVLEPADGAALLRLLAERSAAEQVFVFARSQGLVLATRERGESLDVEVLHEELLPALGGELSFDSRPDRLLDRVGKGDVALGVLLHAIDAESLFRVIRAGARLPKKSTFFTPKIPSGVVIRDFAT